MELQATVVFEKNYDAIFKSDKRYIVNQGGSRSSKTVSLCQLLLLYAIENPGKVVNIFRKALRSTKRTVLKDFKNALASFPEEIYTYNKTDATFTFINGSVIAFHGADDEQKLRGLYSDLAWINEANELLYEDFTQIAMRCTGKMIFDYNPSANQSWLYDLPAEKSIIIHSTYKDNPFLTDEQIEYIESFKESDDAYYKIFALGVRAQSKENVYSEWKVLKKRPEHLDKFIYGLDFGFTHPTALVKVWYNEKCLEIYVEEILYESGHTSTDLIKAMNRLGIERNVEIIADYARPEIIKELRSAGYRVINAIKDVLPGINSVRSFNVLVDHMSSNVIRENQLYKWSKINGQITDRVVKQFDDTMDALRYAVFYIKKYRIKIGQDNVKIYNFDL